MLRSLLPMKKNLKAAFTSFPQCIATYVTLIAFVWLIVRNGILHR